MRKNSFGENVMAFFIVIAMLVSIGMIVQANEPKCIKSGCDNKQAEGSSYCYLHKLYTGSRYSSHKSSSSSKSSGSSSAGSVSSYSKSKTANSSSYGSTNKNIITKNKTYDSYDDGYDDIYMDGDYDYDRYCNDSDYADGVDDAMDELGEDW